MAALPDHHWNRILPIRMGAAGWCTFSPCSSAGRLWIVQSWHGCPEPDAGHPAYWIWPGIPGTGTHRHRHSMFLEWVSTASKLLRGSRPDRRRRGSGPFWLSPACSPGRESESCGHRYPVSQALEASPAKITPRHQIGGRSGFGPLHLPEDMPQENLRTFLVCQ